jgi:hypothetical protein
MIRQLEVCEACGEETAVGSPLYSDRRVVTDPTGRRTFVCSSCTRRIVAARRQEPLSDEDRQRLESGAAAFGAFAPGGH